MIVTLLSSCGDSDKPTFQNGTAVDPYIVEAQFQEILVDGTPGQFSSYSDENGYFTFPEPLTQESTVAMVVSGLHNGVPYSGTLKTDLQLAGETLVVSPLTTLMTNLLTTGLTVAETESALQELLNRAGVNLAAALLNDDPVAAAIQNNRFELLEANIAANAFLNTLDRSGEDGYYLTERAGYLKHLEDRNGILVNLVAAIRSCLRPERLSHYRSNNLPADLPRQWQPAEEQLIAATAAVADYLTDHAVQDLSDGFYDDDLLPLIDDTTLEELIHNNYLATFMNEPDFVTYMQDKGIALENILPDDTFLVDSNGNVCPTRNSRPVADAGPDLVATQLFGYDPVQLDGNNSSDGDRDTLNFSWKFLSVPTGSQITATSLSNAHSSTPSFTPDAEGDYLIELRVDDGRLESLPDTVSINAPPCIMHGMCGL